MKLQRLFSLVASAILLVCSCNEGIGAGQSQEKTPPQEQPDVTEEKSISILAIGNSFSVDAMEYVYGMLEDLGYTDIFLGNLFISGCPLKKHAENFTSNAAAYRFYHNQEGEWFNVESFRPLDALMMEEWDYITLQQASGNSGQLDTYEPYLGTMLSLLKEKRPGARLAWHMTWAYQADCSTVTAFNNYNKDQMTMYNAIIDVVQTKILKMPDFFTIIPSGTAVQNLRTSYMGDTITRDGYHMSYDMGRYLTGLTYVKTLLGCDLNDITYLPSKYNYTKKDILAIKDAVNKAIANPFTVTASAYPPDPTYDSSTATVEKIMEHEGYNLEDFLKLDIEYTKYAYYSSGNSSSMNTTQNASLLKKFVATPMYTKEDIPVGSVIINRTGNRYRPEGWVALDIMNGTGEGQSGYDRPKTVTKNIVEVSESWWTPWNFRAFSLSYVTEEDLTDETADKLISGFAVFVPVK